MATDPIKALVKQSEIPSAFGEGNAESPVIDRQGRFVVYPYQIRDLISTARATVSTGTETALLTGASREFRDLVSISFANDSSAATSIDLRDATGGGIVASYQLPANTNVIVPLDVPIPQNAAGDTWTLDLPDITGTTITANGLFVRNV